MSLAPNPPGFPLRGRIALTLAALGLVLAGLWLLRTRVLTPPPVSYAQFQTLLNTGRVSRVVVRGDMATVNLRPPVRPAAVSLRLPGSVTISGSSASADFEARLARRNVDYQIQSSHQWLSILLAFLPLLLLVGVPAFFLTLFLLWLMRRRAVPENLSER